MKYKISATIPTVQYGNIMPELELEGEDLTELERRGDEFIREQWTKYAENGKALPTVSESFKEEVSFTGETILYDENKHIYKSLEGVVLLGASTYAKRFDKPFEAEAIAETCAKAWKVDKSVILEIWRMNSNTSTSFGDSLHNALDIAHKYWKEGELIQKNKKPKAGEEGNYILPKQPVIRKAVLAFVEQFGMDALSEILVTDVKHGMAGRIDRLLVNDEKLKICRVQDYKTSVMDADKLKVYQHQVSYLAKILQNMGWTVGGGDIFSWDGEVWTQNVIDILEVENVIQDETK